MLECQGFTDAYGGRNVLNVIVHIEGKTLCVNMFGEGRGCTHVIFGDQEGIIQKNHVNHRVLQREVVGGEQGYPIVIADDQIVINVEDVIVYIKENLFSANMLERGEGTRVTFGNQEGNIQNGHVKLLFIKDHSFFVSLMLNHIHCRLQNYLMVYIHQLIYTLLSFFYFF